VKTKTTFTSLFLIVVFLWFLSGCSQDGNVITEMPPTETITITDIPQSTSIDTPPTTEIDQPEMQLLDDLGLVFSKVSINYDKNNFPGVVGQVINNSDNVYVDIQIEVYYLDSTDQILDTITTDLLISNLHPGEISPFIILSEKEIPGLDHINSSISEFRIEDLEKGEVIVRNELLTLDTVNKFHLTGELYNGSLDPIKINSLAASLFDRNAEILSTASQAAAPHYLDPGEFGPFRVTMPTANDLNQIPTDYAFYIDAEIVPPLPYPNVLINENPNPYLDQDQSFHLLGEVTNNSERNLFVNLIAGIYDANGDVLDASSTSLPISINPGETLPYEFFEWGLMSFNKNDNYQAVKYSVQIDLFPSPDTNTEYFLLKTQDDVYSFDGYVGTFTGEIINNSGQPLAQTIAIVLVYDKLSGQIIGVGEQVFQTNFKDGDRIRYEITIDLDKNYDPDLIESTILAKGRIVE